MRNLLFFIVVGLSLASCSFSEPVFRGGEKFKFEGIDDQAVKFKAGGIIENDNWFALKVKPSTLDLYVEDEYMGKVRLKKKIKIKKRSEDYVEGDFVANLDDGALFKAMRYATQGKVEVRLKGKVKGGIFFISKKFDVDEKRSISGSDLKMGL